MTCRWLLFAALASAGTCLTPAVAAAWLPPPMPTYTVVTGGGEFLFVMLGERAGLYSNDTSIAKAETAIRAAHPRSGMYRNDGSATFLWAFGEDDSYVLRDELAVFPDGVHLVTYHRVMSNPDYGALCFYVRGERVRSYSARELVSWPGLIPSKGTGAHQRPIYEYLESVGLDTERLECTVRTSDGNRFVFDVRTGGIVSGSRWSVWVGIVLLVALLTATWRTVRLFLECRRRVVPRWAAPVASAVAGFGGLAWVAVGDPELGWFTAILAGCAVLAGVRIRRQCRAALAKHGSHSGSA